MTASSCGRVQKSTVIKEVSIIICIYEVNFIEVNRESMNQTQNSCLAVVSTA